MNRGPNLVLIHQYFTLLSEGGGTRHHELGIHCAERGLGFTVVSGEVSYLTGERDLSGQGVLRSNDATGGSVRTIRAWTPATLHRGYAGRVFSFLGFMVSSAVAAWRAGPVDVVMGTSPPLFQGLSAWLVSFLRRKPLIFEVRDLWPQFAIDMGVLTNPVLIRLSRGLESFLYGRADHIIVNSPAYKDYLVDKGVAPAKVTLIANGVDPELFDPDDKGPALREAFGLEGKFVVTYTGALGPANDIDTILGAAEHLQDRHDIHILLVGDGKDRRRLEALARDRKLANVTFAGSRPKTDIPQILAASDVCVATLLAIPMFRTTYPNKVFDYMAAGRPTVLAIDGVIRRVIEDSEGGLFVAPGDARALADALRRLHDRPQLGCEMGLAARQYVARHFNRRDQAERFVALIRRVAGVDR